jgi:hypothetical protein
MTPAAIGNAEQTLCANNIQIMYCGFLRARYAITIGAGGIGAPLVLPDFIYK